MLTEEQVETATSDPVLGYLPILLALLLAGGVGAFTLLIGGLVRPSNPSAVRILAVPAFQGLGMTKTPGRWCRALNSSYFLVCVTPMAIVPVWNPFE